MTYIIPFGFGQRLVHWLRLKCNLRLHLLHRLRRSRFIIQKERIVVVDNARLLQQFAQVHLNGWSLLLHQRGFILFNKKFHI